MNSLDVIGIGLAITGIIIFLFVVFFLPRFRKIKGIQEYKRETRKFIPKKEEEEKEEYEDNEDFIEEETFNSSRVLARSLGLLIGLFITIKLVSVFSKELETAYASLNSTHNPFFLSNSGMSEFWITIGVLFPIIVIMSTCFFLLRINKKRN